MSDKAREALEDAALHAEKILNYIKAQVGDAYAVPPRIGVMVQVSAVNALSRALWELNNADASWRMAALAREGERERAHDELVSVLYGPEDPQRAYGITDAMRGASGDAWRTATGDAARGETITPEEPEGT